MLKLCIACVILFTPPIVQDARLIASSSVEWAIGWNATGTRAFVITDHSADEVNIDEYNDVLRDGGFMVHNHPYPHCPTLSTSDVLIAAAMNMHQVASVSAYGPRVLIISVIRAPGGWKLKNINLDVIRSTAGKWTRWYGDVCRAWDQTWQELCPQFGCEYVTQ